MAASSNVRFSPYFHFRFDRKWLSDTVFPLETAVNGWHSMLNLSTAVLNVGRRQISVLPVAPKPKVVSSIQTVADRPVYCIGVE